MPANPRVRGNNAFGQTSDDPLTVGAVAFNSTGLANLPTIAVQHATITLDPLREFGEPEIVVVTAHTASATVATIIRGQYSTVARQHPAGTLWVHAPLNEDFIQILTSGSRPSDPYRGQMIFETDTNKFVARSTADIWQDAIPLGAWVTYVPTFTNLTVGSGALDAAYSRIGRIIFYRIKWVFGAGSAVGTSPTYTLPVAPNATYTANYPMHNACNFLDSGTTVFLGTTEFASGSTVTILVSDDAANGVSRASVTSTIPMTWASGDTLFITGTYEAVS